jgi:hypothetical protein
MRLRRCLLVCALVLVMPLVKFDCVLAQDTEQMNADPNEMIAGGGDKGVGPEAARPVVPMPTPLAIARKDVVFVSAYMDVYQMLSANNPCSDFFGGPVKALEVLNGLFGSLETARMPDSKIGLSMSGRTRSMSSARTGVSYRLFEKAVINTNGPFYQRRFSTADPFVPNVGSFQPNTREARAAILLHEMGHLVQGGDGRWLLPNDGTSDELSRKNTAVIETRCGGQIKELRRKAPRAKQQTQDKGDELKEREALPATRSQSEN